MLQNRIGNITPGRRSVGTGSGIGHKKTPFGHITYAGKVGDVARVSSNEFFNAIAQGYIFVQSSGCTVRVYKTLADIDLALNPEYDTADFWVLETTTTAGQIAQLTTLATALRIEFVSAGMVYVAGL